MLKFSQLSLSLSCQIPASNSVALDMSLQTPSDVKVKKEAPVEVDSSPPDSPESISGNSDHSREALVKAKVEKWEEGGWHACGILNDEKKSVWLAIHVMMPQESNDFSESAVPFIDFSKLKSNHGSFSQDTPPRISAPTPTIVRPGSLPLHLGFDALQPTMPSPTSVITQAPPSNRTSLGWGLAITHTVNSSLPSCEILPEQWTVSPFCLSCISPVLRPATTPWWCFPPVLLYLCFLVPCTYPLSSM